MRMVNSPQRLYVELLCKRRYSPYFLAIEREKPMVAKFLEDWDHQNDGKFRCMRGNPVVSGATYAPDRISSFVW